MLRDRIDRLNRRLPEFHHRVASVPFALLRQECLAASMGGEGRHTPLLVRWLDRSPDMKSFLKDFIRDDSGASAAEYALILAIVGTGIAAAAFALGGAISGAMQDATSCINSAKGGGTPSC